MKRFISVILILCIIIPLALSVKASDSVSDNTADILSAYLLSKEYNSLQELADSFADSVATGEEWFVLAISRLYGSQISFDKYADSLLRYVKEKKPSIATTRQLISLSLLSIGRNDPFVSETLNDSIGNNGLMSYVFALHLCNNLDSCEELKDFIVNELISKQLSDGGWAVIGNTGDPDVTSMTIQALAPFYHCDSSVFDSVNNALSLLSEQQLDNGGYVSMGKENPESPAQVLIALSSLGIDAQNDVSFIKNGNTLFDAIERFQTKEKLYAHTIDGEANDSATRQVFLGYAAYSIMNKNSESLYCFSKNSEPLFSLPVNMQENQNSEFFACFKTLIKSKAIILVVIIVFALLCCLVLFAKGKRSYKSYTSVLILTIIICILVLSINISKPEDYYGKSSEINGNSITTSITIRCNSVGGKKDYIPLDGLLLFDYEIQVPEKATVYDQLIEACKQNSIQLECKTNGYVSGINYIYEFDFGELSGWLFKLNNQFSSIGSSEVELSEGDHVEWVYSLELGKDVGDISYSD